jgi:hypothetical protein
MQSIVVVCSALLLGLAGLAFWPAYLSRPAVAVDPYTHAHAIVGATWLGIALTQSFLIGTRRIKAHRALGLLSPLAAAGFVLSAVLLAHYRFSRMEDPTFAREAYTLYLPLSASILFSLAFWLAFVHRRTVALHSRFMLCTLLLLVDPVLARVLAFYLLTLPQFWHYQLLTFGVEIAAVLALYFSLPQHEHLRAPFRPFAAVYISVLLLWFALPRTAFWLSFAEWFRRLPFTA